MRKLKPAIVRAVLICTALSICLILLLMFINKNTEAFKAQPIAKDGVLDLKNWDFKNQGIVKLDGQWQIYYNQLLTPEDFKNKSDLKKTGVINIPGNFSTYKYTEKQLDGKGYATYRLKVLTNNAEDLYAIKTEFIQTAHKIWINGKLVAGSGVVGTSRAEMIPKVATSTGAFYNNTGELDIVLQTSNFYYGTGQIDSILLGTESQISRYNAKKLGFDLFLFGSTIVAVIYHFAMFLRRKKNKAPLYFAIVCALVGLRTILVGERLIYSIFPNMNYVLNTKLLLWTFFLYIPMLVLFIDSFYPKIISKSIVKFSKIVGIAYFLIILLLPVVNYNNLLFPFEIVALFLLLYILCNLSYRYLTQGEGYPMVIVAVFILFITRLNDILYEYSIIQTDSYAPLGMLIFILAQSYVLADRFSTAFSSVEEMTEKLKSVNRLKDDFLANTSHELKTPLNGIIGLSQSLSSELPESLSKRNKETLNLIEASAKRLSNLVNDILDFSKLKNNDINLEMKAVDIRQLTNVVIKFCEPFIGNKHLKIINNIDYNTPPIYGDENRIEQILYNLIGNAVKFTDAGEIVVSTAESGDYIEITVSDTGIGIALEQINKIFDPYEQCEGIDRRYGGTGLGLHIARKLVRLHGGEIKVKSVVDQGSKFIFTLPKHNSYNREIDNLQIDTDKEELNEMRDYKENDECSKEVPKNGKRILIVDDEPINIRVLKHSLEQREYTVVTAANGREAIEKVANDKDLDLVILDIMLPDMLGFEVCTLLREKYSLLELPVLIMTADNRAESLVVSFECGANDYLKKPFERSELLTRVKTLIDLKHSVKEAIKLQFQVENTTKQVEELSENFEENKRMLTEVLEYDKLKTEFFANVSHELRTPLNVIWSTTQLLQSIKLTSCGEGYDINRYLNIMNQNTLRLLRLINNLIDTTKIDGGYLALNLANDNIIYAIEEIVLSAASYTESQNINLIFDTEVEEKYMAFDSDKIERIVLNILSNAIKFTERGGSIFVNIYDLGDRIKISIKDTGIGIPEDKLESVFGRFAQVNRPISRRGEGSGIGLALVKSLVELHDGKIYVKSKVGEGSEFIIELPVTLVEEKKDLEPESSYKDMNSKYIESVQIEFSDIYE
ncbi:ATP-binding protein [Clostridium aciditolerans]|uniref:Stage 0 sporulation protein A homolog n=1 Tax=Clostridium aciditolerans TaxID=339861 RepID=A0A934M5B7_9CLOT|nr:ATP-binding protein [Clostridium aciditolerans]MBI6875112.1 response regulator [Clostridium aciditolerans]